MTAAISWDLYRSFLALVREGSLSAAARRLGLTQPTLSRHLAELEDRLGASLFTRSPQGLAPTDAALALQPIAATMESAAEAMERGVSNAAGAIKGPVRIAASEIMGAEVLPQILKDFVDHHPEATVELVLSNRSEDLLRRDADIAVRMVRPTQTALLARKLGSVSLGLYATRAYLDRHGAPTSFDDIARHHRLIGFDRDPAALTVLEGLDLALSRTSFALRVDNDLAQLAALRAGYGVGACQVPIAQRTSDLVRVVPHLFDAPMGVWLVMHEDLRSSPKLRAVYDHMATGLLGYLRPEGAAHDVVLTTTVTAGARRSMTGRSGSDGQGFGAPSGAPASSLSAALNSAEAFRRSR